MPTDAGRFQRLEVAICTSLAIEELDHLRALECLPTPELLNDRLRARANDVNLLVGAVSAWCNWPGSVTHYRGMLFTDDKEKSEWWIENLMDEERLLILDDIGADRLAGQDWAGEVLGRVIDQRLRREGPTCWTSNLSRKELAERYGARTFSRLQELAPAILLPDLPDQRLKKRPPSGGSTR